jgi:hypothetical protein
VLSPREEVLKALLVRVMASKDGRSDLSEDDIFERIKEASASWTKQCGVYGDVGQGRLLKDSERLERMLDSVSDVGFHGISKVEPKLCKDCILRGYPLIGEVDMATIQHFCSLVIQGHPNIMMKPPRMKYVAKPKVLNRIRIGILRSDAPTRPVHCNQRDLKALLSFYLLRLTAFPPGSSLTRRTEEWQGPM